MLRDSRTEVGLGAIACCLQLIRKLTEILSYLSSWSPEGGASGWKEAVDGRRRRGSRFERPKFRLLCFRRLSLVHSCARDNEGAEKERAAARKSASEAARESRAPADRAQRGTHRCHSCTCETRALEFYHGNAKVSSNPGEARTVWFQARAALSDLNLRSIPRAGRVL